jgi:hypothetical protein
MATDDELRMRATLVDNASGPLRALERTFRDFRGGEGAPKKLAEDFSHAHIKAKEFGEVMRSGSNRPCAALASLALAHRRQQALR